MRMIISLAMVMLFTTICFGQESRGNSSKVSKTANYHKFLSFFPGEVEGLKLSSEGSGARGNGVVAEYCSKESKSVSHCPISIGFEENAGISDALAKLSKSSRITGTDGTSFPMEKSLEDESGDNVLRIALSNSIILKITSSKNLSGDVLVGLAQESKLGAISPFLNR